MNKKVKYFFPRLRLFFVVAIIAVFSLSCERPVSVSPPDEPPADGFLFVDSAPKDARIFINSKDRRRLTPDSVTWLETGDYEVTLKKDFFRDTTFMVSITEGERTDIFVDYLSNPSMLGEISCISNPEAAAIFLDDEDTGLVTPGLLSGLTPGYHKIKYVLPDHRVTEINVTVSSSEITNAQATLVNITIWQDYNTSNSGLPTNSLTDVLVDSRGIIWIGSVSDGLIEFNNGNWINYRESNSDVPNDQIKCIEEGPKGHVWVGTFEGVWQIMPREYKSVWNNRNSSIPGSIINDIAAGSINAVWFAVDGGLCKLLLSDIYYWQDILTINNSNLPGDNVTAIAVDGLNKWAGTEINGVVRFSNSQNLTIHTTATGLTRNTISALEIDKVGVVWVGHNSQVHASGGLSRYNGAGWDNLSHLIHGEDVSVIFADSKNQKWIGTGRALYVVINANVVEEFDYESTGLYLDNVKGISQDAEGYIWLATKMDGLIRVNTNKL